ncbi:hypothetical protein HWD35_24570 [Tsukamurella tyrosinosolvens]|uniref:hypothetical protein n=1 Tax=Tsukamurella tyrosinosolvens TaxID=57704 RepID=UPI001CE0D2B2|nr:hypothetical protein [Tsukamurella tyrosinosolvens]MCA4997897.1 hypothetical protein [Tsukamurella tyrosinosolvens]
MSRPPTNLADYQLPIARDGYTVSDLVDQGLSPYLARKAIAQYGPLKLVGSREVPIPAPVSPSVVALIASGDTARATLAHRIYIRDRTLTQPVRRIATHLGTDNHQIVDTLHPVIARALIADGSIKPRVQSASAQRVINRCWTSLGARFFLDRWLGPADVLVLGAPITIHVPLGYAGRGGIAGTSHFRLSALQAARQLKGLPTI